MGYRRIKVLYTRRIQGDAILNCIKFTVTDLLTYRSKIRFLLLEL